MLEKQPVWWAPVKHVAVRVVYVVALSLLPAMMGMSCGAGGKIMVTDMDNIEVGGIS